MVRGRLTAARLLVLGALVTVATATQAMSPTPSGASQGASNDGQRARAAVRAFIDAEGRGLGPHLLLSLRALSGHDHPVSVDLLLSVFQHGSPALRPTARRVLAGYSAPDTLEHLVDAGLGHREGGVREQALLALAVGRPAGIDWVASAVEALEDGDPRVRAVAIYTLGRGRHKASQGRIVDMATDTSERVRAAVPGALVRLADRRALPVLETLSSDRAWRVRLAVIVALREIKTRGSVELLIEILGFETGRLREDVLSALIRLTGRNYGVSMAAWERWLANAPAGFLAEGDEAALAPESDRGVQTVARYYGLTTTSDRFCLVTDVSTSMDLADQGRYGSGTTSRLDSTKLQLRKLIEGLDPSVSVGLITFSDDVDSWRTNLSTADKRGKQAALREVLGYRTIGGTNVFAALERVFQLSEADIDQRRLKNPAPDTVFLLTDGAPSVGPIRDTELLLEYVTERNRVAQLRFHTVVLTKDAGPRDFLRALASQTDGDSVSPLD